MTNPAAPRLALLAAVAGLLVGCETARITTDGRPLPPTPRPAPRVPPGAQVDQITLVPHIPFDSNGNGYPDVVPVSSNLFTLPEYATLEAAQGSSFTFVLFPQGERNPDEAVPIATWHFEGDELVASRRVGPIGVGYTFELSILDSTSDVMGLTVGNLRGWYQPPDGAPVYASDEFRPVRLGRNSAPR